MITFLVRAITHGKAMAKIHDIDQNKEVWLSANCLCVNCSHTWVAVVHEDRQNKLECPDCGEMKGAVIGYHED